MMRSRRKRYSAEFKREAIRRAGEEIPGFPEVFQPYISVPMKVKKSHRELLGNLEFQNILAGRIQTTTGIVEWRDKDIDNQLRTVIELIEHELEK